MRIGIKRIDVKDTALHRAAAKLNSPPRKPELFSMGLSRMVRFNNVGVMV
jgi:hypothetical protein